MTRPSPGRTFRNLLDRDELLIVPGALDPFTAWVVADIGFSAVYLGGNAIGIHLGVGQPFVTLTETVDCSLRVLRAIDVPLVVDAGSGFGDPAHVYRSVRELERAGIAAIHLDDQLFPKRAHYHQGKGRVVPVAEAAERLSSAVRARVDRDLVVIARTDVLRVTGSEEQTIERCGALVDAGADMLMVLDLGPESLTPFRRTFPDAPFVWIGGVRAPVPTRDELARAGFRAAVYPFNAVAAVGSAVARLWAGLRDDGSIKQSESLLASERERALAVTGMRAYWEIERATTERAHPI